MKTRTSSLLAAVIAMTALISVNASAQGPDGGRRSGSHNGGARVENHSATRDNHAARPSSHSDNRSYSANHNGSHNNGGPAINNRGNNGNHNGNHNGYNNGNHNGYNNGPAHNNGNHYGDNRGPANNNRPMPNNHINPSVGHNPGTAPHNNHYADRPAPRPHDHYRPAPRPRDHYRRPIPPRYFNRSAAYYRRAHIFADCLAAAAANALLGAIVANIPPYYTEVIINGAIFYLADNILYRPVAIYGRPYFEIVSPYYY